MLRHFLYCVIYPVCEPELHDATELIEWPPQQDDDERSEEELLQNSQSLLEQVSAMARVFAVQAPDRDSAEKCLIADFAHREIVPALLEPLNVALASHLVEQFDSQPNAICCFDMPFLFVMRGHDETTVADLIEFCVDIMTED
jgi:hypothetical protein